MTPRVRNRGAGCRGQASVVLIGALFVGLAFVGLAVDGARVFTARRDLQNVADAAALAGASAVDESVFRSSEGAAVRLDPDAAWAAAVRVLAASQLPAGTDVTVDASPERVTVRLGRAVPMTFLRITGVRAQPIGATASAAPQSG